MNRDFVEMLSALSASGASVFQIGLPPCRIDILSSISGVEFDDAWARRILITIGGLSVGVIGRADFVANKQAAGRAKDLLDLTLLPPEA